MAKQPDKWERLVGAEQEAEVDHMHAHSCVGGKVSYTHPCNGCGNGVKTFTRQEVINLLRKQHRAVVRMVKNMQKGYTKEGCMDEHILLATVLDQLNERAK